MPLKALRFVPTLCGALIIPTVYHLMVAIGLTHKTAALAALLLIFGLFWFETKLIQLILINVSIVSDNALLTQSRFILMDTILIFFSLFGILSFVISTKKQTFTLQWFCWLFTSSLFITFGFCVKYIGIFSLFLIYFVTYCDFWLKIADKSIKTVCFDWLESCFDWLESCFNGLNLFTDETMVWIRFLCLEFCLCSHFDLLHRFLHPFIVTNQCRPTRQHNDQCFSGQSRGIYYLQSLITFGNLIDCKLREDWLR